MASEEGVGLLALPQPCVRKFQRWDSETTMKLRSCWLALPMLCFVAAFLATKLPWPSFPWAASRAGPIADFPTELELGAHEVGEEATKHFTISNRGGRDLVISHIQTSCACAGMEQERNGELFRLETLPIRPGESAPLLMRVTVPDGMVGTQLRNVVTFHTNDPIRPTDRI